MSELKPCPFCGSKETILMKLSKGWTIICNRCAVEGPYKKFKNHAIKAWNKRDDSHLEGKKASYY